MKKAKQKPAKLGSNTFQSYLDKLAAGANVVDDSRKPPADIIIKKKTSTPSKRSKRIPKISVTACNSPNKGNLSPKTTSD